jgi:hypothetical protein
MRMPGDSLETAGLGVPGVGMLPVGVASAEMGTLAAMGALAVMGVFAAVMASTAVVVSAGAVAWTLAATMVVMPSAVV